ncbi:TetR/AcrR family transcriptional regulator [Saccharothrix longispora]|uniref:AcrR family transcriptional regulator n=1 Tax=Saccharothrix longispora TaxID=33920 RepID=A0ABU1PSY4_9PSEU|nr:TetR/AcrR family transcriptional regulator [Saccharothrix longispora]MDR6593750.1 AcrR family transcriptional regulator [Saccharothrix longispora]
MVVYAGQGDPRRSMRLLWRAAEDAGEGGAGVARPGPRPGLSVEEVVGAAIAIADRDGMAALSMRAVGERLGRTAMALYTYVPNKAELIDLMCDAVRRELPVDYPLGGGWRPALEAWAADTRAFYLRHPWVLQVSQARPVLGPGEFAALEALLRVLRGTGLPVGVLRGVVGALTQFVRGAAAVVSDARRAAADTGVSDEEWWFARSPVLDEVAPDFGERFPLAAWIGVEEPPPVPGDPCASYLERGAVEGFTAGLAVLLDGIEVAVARLGEGAPA